MNDKGKFLKLEIAYFSYKLEGILDYLSNELILSHLPAAMSYWVSGREMNDMRASVPKIMNNPEFG